MWRVFFLLVLCSPPWLLGEAVIQGVVRSQETKLPVSGATVYLKELRRGAVAGPNGFFRIQNVPAGSYTIIVRSVGYQEYQRSIRIAEADTLKLEILLAESIIRTQEVVVSAAKRVQAVQEVPVSVAVVPLKSIELRGHTQLDQILRYVPGVYVTRDQINIRGTSGFSLGIGSRTFVLLDGFPLLAGDGGDVKFDAFPLFVTRQIEVVKGGGSALYGSGALGGVVNILTADAQEESPLLRARLQTGGYSLPKYEEWRYRETPPLFVSTDVSVAHRWDNFGVVLSTGYDTDEGYHAFYDATRYRFFGKVHWENAHHRIRVLGNVAVQDRADWVYWRSLRYATLPPENTDTNQRVLSRKYLGGLHWQALLHSTLILDSRMSVYHTNFETLTGNEPVTDFHSSAYSWNWEEQLTWIADTGMTLTTGFQTLWNHIGESFVGKRNQLLGALYAQYEWKWSHWTATVGTRSDVEWLDTPQTVNYQISPKLGVLYGPSEAVQFRASVGKGFRIPTIGERFSGLLYGPFRVRENPELKPEENWSAEAGTEVRWFWQKQLWKAEFSTFVNFLENMVEPQLIEGAVIQFRNVPKAVIRGVELFVEGWLPDRRLGMQLSIGFYDPWNQTENRFLKYRSRWLAQTRLFVPLSSAIQAEVEYRFQKKFDEVDAEVSTIIPDADARVDAHVLDFRLHLDLMQIFSGIPVTMTLNVENALNYYYTEVLANLAPLRKVSLQILAAF